MLMKLAFACGTGIRLLVPPFASNPAVSPVLEIADTILGDVNQDDVVNFFDINPFIGVLSAGDFQTEADIDENGVVDFFDINPFIAILSGN